MTIKAHLAEFVRQHKALEHEIAEASAHSSTDDLKIMELKRRKLISKDEIGAFATRSCIVRTRVAARRTYELLQSPIVGSQKLSTDLNYTGDEALQLRRCVVLVDGW